MAVISFNANIPALQAERRLAQSSKRLNDTYERLSSGLRVVRASDDAAGLAVASSLRVDSCVYHQGVRNLNAGISLLNIAEGATSELRDILFRLRELATQSANGTLSTTQRQSLDTEGRALVSEYNRIVAVTEFNGYRPLDGTTSSLVLQAGYRTTGQLHVLLGQEIERVLGLDTTTTTATGTFQGRVSYSSGVQPMALATGDLNGDGLVDIVTAE